MQIPLSTFGPVAVDDETARVIQQFESLWNHGAAPDLQAFVKGLRTEASPTLISLLAKVDLQNRFDQGEVIDARVYLEHFPEIASDADRALSLIYEEFCLCEESGGTPDPSSFCDRYPTWADSLASQLQHHRDLSVIDSAPVAPTKFPNPGERFSKFDLDEVLGKGGSACVFLASDGALGGRKFVLKVSPDRGAEPAILGKLNHRHIIPVHSVDIEPESGLRGLCMPYLPGPTLDAVIGKASGKGLPKTALELRRLVLPGGDSPEVIAPVWNDFPAGESYAYAVAWIGRKLAEALAHAHEQGILHRDVKPANILLTYEQGPQLLDFNLAHAPNSAEEAQNALRGGTLPYMAPEQLRAFLSPELWSQVRESADLYALGLVLREMLTGVSHDTTRKSRLSLPRAIQEALDARALPSTPLSKENPGVPPVLGAIVDSCLAFDPKNRYPSARKLADDLGHFLEHRSTEHVVNPSLRGRLTDWLLRKQRGRRIALAAAILGPLVLWGSALFAGAWQVQAVKNLFHNGNYEAVARSGESLIKANPNDIELLVFYAESLRRTGQLTEANRYLKEVIKDNRSLEVLRRIEDRHSNSDALLMAVGGGLLHDGRYEEAIATYQRVKASQKERAQAWLGIANAEHARGNAAKTFDAVDVSLEAFRRDYNVRGVYGAPNAEELSKLFLLEVDLIDGHINQGLVKEASGELDRLNAQTRRLSTMFGRKPKLDSLVKLLEGLSNLFEARNIRALDPKKQEEWLDKTRRMANLIEAQAPGTGGQFHLFKMFNDGYAELRQARGETDAGQ